MKSWIFLSLLVLTLPALSDDKCMDEKKTEAEHLKIFDDLDFNVFSNQRWDELKKSHAPDIVVHFPDGRTTKGIDQHITDLKGMFVALPDLRIKQHPIKIAEKEYTAVQGIMEGTFTKPMTLPDGKVIQPTGKKLKLSMVTIGKWKNGVMTEEFLYWDNDAYQKQIGLK